MEPLEVIQHIAGADATIRELISGSNRVFRVLADDRTTIVKVYANAARERRESRALEALSGIKGVPVVLDRGTTDEHHWVRMQDAGKWNLATLPENPNVARKAGQVLHAVHQADPESISNLSSGMDADWVAAHYASTFERLNRYRRRLNLPSTLIDRGMSAPRPIGSSPRPAHTHPLPAKFLVDEDGEVTLIDWEWATLAPSEWDLSLALWRTELECGPDAAEGLAEGYGARLADETLAPWVAYHAATQLLTAAETQQGRLDNLAYLVAVLDTNLAS